MRLPFHVFNLASIILPARWSSVRARLLRWCGASVGAGVSLSSAVRVYGEFVEIGDQTWVSPETVFLTGPGGHVTLGPRCDVGPGVCFATGSHVIGGSKRRAGQGTQRPIVVGAGSWIGARSVLLGGSVIGAGSIVAAGSVVMAGNYPPDVLLAGVPARVKKELNGQGDADRRE